MGSVGGRLGWCAPFIPMAGVTAFLPPLSYRYADFPRPGGLECLHIFQGRLDYESGFLETRRFCNVIRQVRHSKLFGWLICFHELKEAGGKVSRGSHINL
jgi:hypothetical protein